MTTMDSSRVPGVRPSLAPAVHGRGQPLVLVVDDGAAQRFLTRLTLRELAAAADFDVAEAATVDEARDRLHRCETEGRPTFVLCDLRMPLATGIDLLRSTGAATGRVPRRFVLLTSSPDPRAEREAYSLGADDFLVRSFDDREMRERIEGRIERWLAACAIAADS